jgi:hypothetical protein
VLLGKRLEGVVDAEMRGLLDALVDALHALLLSTSGNSLAVLEQAAATLPAQLK